MGVYQTYRSLSDEQKQALATKKLEINRPAAELIEFLKPLAVCDTMADKVRTKLGCSFAIGILLSVILFFVFVANGIFLGTILVVALAGVTIWLGWFWSWTKRIDVSNNFRQFTLPVLTVLKDDFDPAEPVHLRLDLTAPNAKEKLQSKSDPYKQGAYYKIIDSFYADNWMDVDGRLVDGTKLSWSVNDFIRERSKTKRNPRGKIKSKTKYAKKTEIEVQMALKKKTYDLATPAGGEMSSDAKRNVVKLSRRFRSDSLDPVDPRALLDLVADVFRSTRPAKEAGA